MSINSYFVFRNYIKLFDKNRLYNLISIGEIKKNVPWFRFMVFNATFNNISVISWRSVLLVEENGENHQPAVNH
jgi:hypothetical protein